MSQVGSIFLEAETTYKGNTHVHIQRFTHGTQIRGQVVDPRRAPRGEVRLAQQTENK